MSIRDQCRLLGVARSSVYYEPSGPKASDLAVMRRIAISMDGRGRAFDNIFVERLWRSVKHEEVYLKDYADVDEARHNLGGYLRFYNQDRLHQALDYQTPWEVYFAGRDLAGRQKTRRAVQGVAVEV